MGEDGDKDEYNDALTKLCDRDAKVARFHTVRDCAGAAKKLAASRARRERLGIAADEDLDGLDGEGVERELWLAELKGKFADCVDEVVMISRELHMLNQMASGRPLPVPRPLGERPREGELTVTRIDKDATGNLVVAHGDNLVGLGREDMSRGVFRPGWNLPTMSLEELGEIEYKEAMERGAATKASEAEALRNPKAERMEYLVKKGLEDDAGLVDKAAKLDQDWDDWKDANPKGQGNKMADVGDRNF